MKIVIMFVAVLIGGCTSTPRGMEHAGPPVLEWFSKRPPVDIAACIASNGDNLQLGLLGLTGQSSMRPGAQPGSYEVSYSNSGWLSFFARVIATNTGGSLARVWRSAMPTFAPYGEGSATDQIRRGCD